MAIAVFQDLILDFLTESQIRRYVPYNLCIEGISANVVFEQDQFETMRFAIKDSMVQTPLKIVYLSFPGKLLVDYDPYLLSEMDGYTLFELYYHPAFGLRTWMSDEMVAAAMLAPENQVASLETQIDESVILETLMESESENIMHITSSMPETELDAPMSYHDRYLLVEFDPDNLFDMYDISFSKGGL